MINKKECLASKDKKKLMIRVDGIDAGLWKAFLIACMQKDKHRGEGLTEAIQNWLGKDVKE